MYKIENLCKSFIIDDKQVPVIKNLNLEIDPDKITVILGKSGCGKTTLLRLLCGLEKSDSGSIPSMTKGKLSMIFQDPCLMPWLTVKDNIVFGLSKKEINKNNLNKLIETVGLSGYEKAYPWQLSGGMQHRVSIARSLIQSPDILLLDEPFASLDHFTRTQMQGELQRIHNETKMGGIFVTHSIDEALILGDFICIMSDGVIKERFEQQTGEKNDIHSEESLSLRNKILNSLES